MGLFENADMSTVMCACLRMLYFAMRCFWVRGSISVWTENICFHYRIGVDGEHFMRFQNLSGLMRTGPYFHYFPLSSLIVRH